MNGPASAQAATMAGRFSRNLATMSAAPRSWRGRQKARTAPRDEGTLFCSPPPNLAIFHEDDPAKPADVSQPGGVLNVLVLGDSVVLGEGHEPQTGGSQTNQDLPP